MQLPALLDSRRTTYGVYLQIYKWVHACHCIVINVALVSLYNKNINKHKKQEKE